MKGARILSLAAMCLCSIPLICGCTTAEVKNKAADMTIPSPVFDIPKLDGIVVDGDPSDWGDNGFRVEILAASDGTVQDPERFDARFRLGWNQQGLLVLIRGRNDAFSEGETVEDLWEGDCVELFMADKRGGNEMIQAIIGPGMDPEHPDLRYRLYDRRKDATLKKTKPTITAARTKVDDNNYIMEVLLPWENLGIKPQNGTELAFQIYVDDQEKDVSEFFAIWYPQTRTNENSKRAHCIRLSDNASPSVFTATRVYYDGVQSTRVVLVGTPETPGETISVVADGKEIARGTLTRSETRCNADLYAPFPSVDCGWTSLDIQIDGKTVDILPLPDAEDARKGARPRLSFKFDSFCFEGSQFPKGDFENPTEAQNIIGSYAIDITYYDADCNPVTSADKPGRYTAVVVITPSTGSVIKRFYTLFRMPGKIKWDEVISKASKELPLEEKSGDDRHPWHRSPIPGDVIKDLTANRLIHSEYGAMLLAWRQEADPEIAVTAYTRPESCNTRWIQQLKRKTGDAVSLEYFVYLPEVVKENPEKKWPIILWLHGGGWPKDELADNAVVEYGREHKDFPFIVVAPYCAPPNSWSGIAPELVDLVEELSTKYPVDRDRFYLTGFSMGGAGSWRLVTERPDLFAAVVPICGFADPQDAERIKDVPIWCVHAVDDAVVPIKCSEVMVNALEKINGRIRFSAEETGGHSVWRRIHGMDEFYSWLLSQTLGNPTQPPFTAPDTAPDATPDTTPDATE